MKICIVSMYYGPNYGQGLCVQKIAEELSKNNQVHVIHSQKGFMKNKKNLFHHFLDAGNTAGIDFIRFKYKINKTFNELNKKNNFDLIYGNSFESLGAIEGLSVPFYYHARGTVKGNALNRPKSFFLWEIARIPFIKLFEKWDKECCMKAKKIFVPSRQVEREIIEYYNAQEKKIEIIPDGVDFGHFSKKTSQKNFRKKLGLEKNKVILFAGRIVPQKGLQFLVEAMPLVLLKMPEAKLLVAGESTSGNYLNEIRHKIRQFGIENDVIFAGYVGQKNMPEAIASADLVISPSTYEPFGIINLEAIAMQKKLLVSELTATKNLFNGCAQYFNPYNPEEIAEKTLKLLNSRKKINAKKCKELCRKCSWKNIGKQLHKIFENGLK